MKTRFGTSVLYQAATVIFLAVTSVRPAVADDTSPAGRPVLAPASERFRTQQTEEVPDFRRHMVPLLGKLGCNSRACHGSFQGQGDFRLSLFGYDFKLDHEGLSDRVDTDTPEDSYAIQKPLLEEPHRGGKRFDKDSWEYNLFVKWIAGGAQNIDVEKTPRFERLEITPAEIRFNADGETVPLKVVSIWSDGSPEDVTCLCRFQTNDEAIAAISKEGEVTSHQSGDTHVVVFYDNGVHPVPVIRPVSSKAGDAYPPVHAETKIDGLVVRKLSKLGIVPSKVAGDAQFLRRVSLDMTGTLPTPQEIEAFLADSSSDKRARRIDELLERPTYAAWWATRFADWTGNSDDQLNNVTPVRNQAARDWYEWLRVRLENNIPYDDIAEGFVLAGSREKAESYREFCEAMAPLYKNDPEGSYAERSTMPHYWARNNFRTPEDRAIGFAYNFLGIRIQCAQCHKHPFDQWTMDDFHQFKNFFANTQFRGSPDYRSEADAILKELGVDKSLKGNQLRRELRDEIAAGKVIPYEEVWTATPEPPRKNKAKRANRPRRRGGAGAREARLLGAAEKTDLTQFDDPRQPLMDWLRNDEQQLFAKATVNRVWSCYFNVGIVEPPDDLSLANPPSNAELLDYLTTAFVASGYDLKWLHREITNSDTYQRSWHPNDTNRRDERNFSHAIPRRLPAEVALDAIVAATCSDDAFAELHRDVSGRNIAEASAGSRYNENPRHYALSVFGRSIRESNCDCDRSQEPSLLQTVFLQNDAEIYNLIDRNRGGWINQLASELKLRQTRKATGNARAAARQRTSARKQIERTTAQLKQAEKAGNEALAGRLERRLAALTKRLEDLNPGSAEEPSAIAQQVKPETLDEVVRDAYLRTLSREPKPEERERAVAYVTNATDQLSGIRDLLWALINTKEFIVNH